MMEMICSPFVMLGAPGSLDFFRSDHFAEHDQRVRVLLRFGRRVELAIFVRELLNTCGDQKSMLSFAFALDNHTSLDKSSDEFPIRPKREKMRGWRGPARAHGTFEGRLSAISLQGKPGLPQGLQKLFLSTQRFAPFSKTSFC